MPKIAEAPAGRSRTAKIEYFVNRADGLRQNSAGSDFGGYARRAVCGG